MDKLTKGQAEAKVCEILVKFESKETGLGASEGKTYFLKDMIFVRLKGVLTAEEKSLAKTQEGRKLIKKMRIVMLDNSRKEIEEEIYKLTGAKILSLHTDISSVSGERIFVMSMDRNMEELYS
ncbi:MAG: DUF2294 domain-containing protein [Candidatus Goldbacteria bacterium]|nr:DUF2294 domain-containing protein [Candidatus Goldiibacteriota bacterium]HPD18446.1 DUF2294 domain-containing protein [Candidatus Goldiibacteriota bacterium]